MQKSVERQARSIEAPAAFSDKQVSSGFEEYDGMCVQCHGGPGVEPAEWAAGLYPGPPMLSKAASQLKPNEVFWILRNGIKMSGMPALGPTHSAEALWDVTAFVEQLPTMTAENYATWRSRTSGKTKGEATDHH